MPNNYQVWLEKSKENLKESRYPDQLEKNLDNKKVAAIALEDARKIYKEIVKELT